MASLFAALTTAVSGLNAQSSSIGNISDNLANAETTGYKAVGTNFEELVNASNATVNNPGGVTATPTYQNDIQGSITSSNVTTNLAISGEGYFAVETASTDAAGTTTFNPQTYYTRQGDFSLDKNGYLVNGSGYYLTAYPVSDGITNTSSTAPVQVSALLDNPVPTANVTYDANLPSNATVGFTSSPSTVEVYDAEGTTHDITYTWTKEGTNSWDLNVSAPDAAGTTSSTSYSATIPFTFNSGTSGTTAGTIETIGTASGSSSPYTVTTATSSTSPASVSLDLTFTGSGTAAQAISLNFGNYNESSGVTQFADSNTAVSVTNFTQDGLGRGSFSSFSISDSGLVSINYSNGTTSSIAQVPVVQFYAQDQLQRVTGGAYTATLAAGSPRYGTAGTNGSGTISSSSLEQSNVDIATEFTDLIQAQQVYSANAKVVTTDDSLLQTTIQMIQG